MDWSEIHPPSICCRKGSDGWCLLCLCCVLLEKDYVLVLFQNDRQICRHRRDIDARGLEEKAIFCSGLPFCSPWARLPFLLLLGPRLRKLPLLTSPVVLRCVLLLCSPSQLQLCTECGIAGTGLCARSVLVGACSRAFCPPSWIVYEISYLCPPSRPPSPGVPRCGAGMSSVVGSCLRRVVVAPPRLELSWASVGCRVAV